MDKTSIGDRMKKYEVPYNMTFPIRLPLLLRLDGHGFHTQVKRWKCKKPFDENLIDAMLFAAKTLCESIPGSQFAFIQSDEITMLIRDDMSTHSEPWFGKEINKILSITATRTANAFNWKFHELEGEEVIAAGDNNGMLPVELSHMAEFDCRGWVMPEYEIINNIIWRQQDYTRNSVQMLGRSHFSHKQLNNKKNNEIQDMLMLEKEVNWNDLPTHHKRGACIIKKEVLKKVPKRDERKKVIEGEFETIMRSVWTVDKEIPIFTQDKNYINQYANVCEE